MPLRKKVLALAWATILSVIQSVSQVSRSPCHSQPTSGGSVNHRPVSPTSLVLLGGGMEKQVMLIDADVSLAEQLEQKGPDLP